MANTLLNKVIGENENKKKCLSFVLKENEGTFWPMK